MTTLRLPQLRPVWVRIDFKSPSFWSLTITALWVIFLFVNEACAVAPSEEAVAKWRESGVYETKVEQVRLFKMDGGCGAEALRQFKHPVSGLSLSANTRTVDTMRTLVLLVDFSDWPGNGQSVFGTAPDFDSILFTQRGVDSVCNATGSLTDYYLENSYGTLHVEGDIVGWLRMPKSYAWYEGGDDGLTRGRILAYDAALAAEAVGVDFSQYDHNGDGICDGLIIIHAGAGAEAGGYGMWSHKWTLLPQITLDGVVVSAYTMNPEEDGATGRLSSIGVFCHEFGHFLGLPDLYDIDGQPVSSQGLGKWSLMASGSYNGGGKTPAHLDAWCKTELGFVTPTLVTSNVYQQSIPEVEHNPIVYKLQNELCGQYEYFLVENRALAGFDSQLPGAGLLIYHVDLSAPTDNRDHLRYLVALEQSDGRNDLAFGVNNRGDGGDPWSVFTATDFGGFTTPNSKTNTGHTTKIAVEEISAPDSIMTANLSIDDSRPLYVIDPSMPVLFTESSSNGNGNGTFEAGETIEATLGVRNLMRPGFNYSFSISGNPGLIEIGKRQSAIQLASDTSAIVPSAPIAFTIQADITPTIDTVWITVQSDSLPSVPGSNKYTQSFPFVVSLGTPEVIVIDDDRGASFEATYTDALSRLRVPHAIWNIAVQGMPTSRQLTTYSSIIWTTGDSAGGVIDKGRIAIMRDVMKWASVMLVTSSGAADLSQIDSTFLADNFGARLTDLSVLHPLITSVDSGRGFDSTSFFYRSDYPVHRRQMVLAPSVEGTVALTINRMWPCATVCQSTTSILMTIPLENLNDSRLDPTDTLVARALAILNREKATNSGGQEPQKTIPQSFILSQNYPNPFNPSTTISFELLPAASNAVSLVRLDIFNVLGERVRTLFNSFIQTGIHTVLWDGQNDGGQPSSSGIYFYRLEYNGESVTKKMVLLK